MFTSRLAFERSGAAATSSSIIVRMASQSPALRALATALRRSICLRAMAVSASNSIWYLPGFHVPSTICFRGSSIPIGWPIHCTLPSLTTNAVGMPPCAAASMYCLWVERSGSVARV